MYLRSGFAGVIMFLSVCPAPAQTANNLLDRVTDTIGQVTDTLLSGVTDVHLGAGTLLSPDYEGSDDYGISVRPLFSFRYRDLVEVDTKRLNVNLIGSNLLLPNERFKAGVLLEVDFGRDESDHANLQGLGDVDIGLETGVFFSYHSGPVRARIRLQQEVAGGHSGMRAIGDLRLIFYKTEKLVTAGSIGLTWSDGDYMDAFFSITGNQSAASGLPAFNAGSGFKDAGFSLSARYSLSRHWSLLAHTSYARLLGDAKDSPIVRQGGSPDQLLGGVFALYRFQGIAD